MKNGSNIKGLNSGNAVSWWLASLTFIICIFSASVFEVAKIQEKSSHECVDDGWKNKLRRINERVATMTGLAPVCLLWLHRHTQQSSI